MSNPKFKLLCCRYLLFTRILILILIIAIIRYEWHKRKFKQEIAEKEQGG